MELDIKPFQARLERLAFSNLIQIVQCAKVEIKPYKTAIVLAQSFNEHMLNEFSEKQFKYHINLIKRHIEEVAYRLFHILIIEGYKAEILPPVFLNEDDDKSNLNKEIAKLAGIGNIGKKGFFVNPNHGVKIIICSILTDAPLEVDKEYKKNLCENCSICDENDFENSFKKCPYGKEKKWRR